MSRAYNYSEIRKGVGILSGLCMGGSSIIGLCCFAKNTILLSKYTKYTELQGVYGPNEPSDRLKALVYDTKEDVKNYISENTAIVPIHVPGMKTLHSGTVGTHYGGVIGLPVLFDYNRKEDIEITDYKRINNAEFYDGDEDKVYDSLLLSESAKKYAIAREILLVNTYQVYIDTALPYSTFYSTYLMIQYAKNILKASTQPVLAMFGVYFVFPLIGLFLWRLIHSNVRLYNESEAEHNITTLGEKYVEGGIEYCTKEIERKRYLAGFKNQDCGIIRTLEDFIYPIFELKDFSLEQRISYLKAHVKQPLPSDVV